MEEGLMSVPDVYISDDGRSFVVRKGGIDWEIKQDDTVFAFSRPVGQPLIWGRGATITEAVDDAVSKLRANRA
jgi:hypothetical protein